MTEDDELEQSSFAWPDIPRICFGPGKPWHLNANLDWVLGNKEVGTRAYSMGYLRAAEALFQHSTECSRLSPDYIIFPLAFLWRHYVELALKEIIVLGRELRGEVRADFTAHHRLGDLWTVGRPYIVEHGSPDAPELANIEANINELERIDPYATGFRYLLDRSQKKRGLSSPPAEVNLRVLQEAMVALGAFFEGVNTCQTAALDYARSSIDIGE